MVSDSRSIHLEPVRPDHMAEIYGWATDTASAFRWRFRGATPAPEKFVEACWSDVLCQYLATDARGRHHGLVVCYGADHLNGHAYWAVQGSPSKPTGTGAMIGMLQLIDHVFRHWAFRKLYAEVPEFNFQQFSSSLSRHTEREASLKKHLFYGGRYWDLDTYALYRERWDHEVRPRFAAVVCDSEGPR